MARVNKADFSMAGTQGTNEYEGVAITSRGRIGYRHLGGSIYRVRVEPANVTAATKMAAKFNGEWKKPGQNGQNRFSTVVTSSQQLTEAVTLGLKALCVTKGTKVTVGTSADKPVQDIVRAMAGA